MMTKTTEKKLTADVKTAFTKCDSHEQAMVNKECQKPQTPRQITDADWNHGIGLN